MATLAEVIMRAIKEHQRLSDGWASEGDKRPVPQYEHIAAAVAAHLLLPETIERAAMAIFLEGSKGHIVKGSLTEEYRGHFRRWSHAAIRAALGEHEGVGRG